MSNKLIDKFLDWLLYQDPWIWLAVAAFFGLQVYYPSVPNLVLFIVGLIVGLWGRE